MKGKCLPCLGPVRFGVHPSWTAYLRKFASRPAAKGIRTNCCAPSNVEVLGNGEPAPSRIGRCTLSARLVNDKGGAWSVGCNQLCRSGTRQWSRWDSRKLRGRKMSDGRGVQRSRTRWQDRDARPRGRSGPDDRSCWRRG